MKFLKKTYWLINPILIAICMLLFNKVFHIDEIWMNSILSVGLAYILSPKIRFVNKQNGEEEQIKWLFFKKVINKQS